ncbi:MAG: hypothetical protein EBR06_06740 [Acidimicrobiia bacterium]|nr:hypothetical protein [Acidimicrobiia bacterium]
MAHFARVADGTVREVIVVGNDDAPTEAAGQAFIASIGLAGEWVQTSYNGNPVEGQDRGKYAGIGDLWDGEKFTTPNGADA